MKPLQRELDIITKAIHTAGQMLLQEARREDGPRGSGYKMEVDTEIEVFLLETLREAFPEDAVVSEETGGKEGQSGRAFIIDPHDGTFDFLRGRRETSVSIGLVDGDTPVLGAVYAPQPVPQGESKPLLLTWAQGDALRLHGDPLTPPPQSSTLREDHVILVSANLSEANMQLHREILAPAQVVPCSSVATRWSLVAAGFADVGFTILNPLSDWDFAASQALLRAAGGELIGPDGEPVRWKNAASSPARLLGYFGARNLALAREVASRMAPVIEEGRQRKDDQ